MFTAFAVIVGLIIWLIVPRVIQQLVLDPLAYKIIAGEITDGAKVAVDVEGDGLAFK